jgi:uncharacterized protein YrzB (UPF0473 family)
MIREKNPNKATPPQSGIIASNEDGSEVVYRVKLRQAPEEFVVESYVYKDLFERGKLAIIEKAIAENEKPSEINADEIANASNDQWPSVNKIIANEDFWCEIIEKYYFDLFEWFLKEEAIDNCRAGIQVIAIDMQYSEENGYLIFPMLVRRRHIPKRQKE